MSTYFLRVFTNEEGNYGDLVSVIVDEGRRINDEERQVLSRELDTGETAFINGISQANISIMHPQGEIDFAGVAVLGASWLLSRLTGKTIEAMRGRAGSIVTWQEDGIVWVRADLATMPPWHYKQLRTATDVDAINLEETAGVEHTMFWAWLDEAKGLIRARTFAKDWSIPEAQGNGSGSMLLASVLNRELQIVHGVGSIIYAKPALNNCANIGGRVVEDASESSIV